MSLYDEKAVKEMLDKLESENADTVAYGKYTACLKHFLTILEPTLFSKTHNLLHEESLEAYRAWCGLTDTFLSWGAFGSPIKFPHEVAMLYSRHPHPRNPDDFVFKMRSDVLTVPHDCELCCFPVPTFKGNTLLDQCPLCGGRVLQNGYFNKHQHYASGLTRIRNIYQERIENVNYEGASVWN